MSVAPPPIYEPAWFKSSYSGGNATECVETAFVHSGVLIRDSKHRSGQPIAVSAAAWTRFVAEARQMQR
ncbi:DUF397 domain-containing protein [Streptomyces sp. F001]|uniref:DUF397 domain-containing protein n=1 Tax=Streptomyces sp. F001 TaxID=1510026 RepID=UPI00101E2FB7|nr:DUF397 domain-containing protein [Streptomyces sp. F001]RZB17136.1 DUF397 domain-containing protein [Streptomyces sp. F001]